MTDQLKMMWNFKVQFPYLFAGSEETIKDVAPCSLAEVY
jgi:hypothetical protein